MLHAIPFFEFKNVYTQMLLVICTEESCHMSHWFIQSQDKRYLRYRLGWCPCQYRQKKWKIYRLMALEKIIYDILLNRNQHFSCIAQNQFRFLTNAKCGWVGVCMTRFNRLEFLNLKYVARKPCRVEQSPMTR